MSKHLKKSKLTGIIGGLLLASSELSAQIVTWGPNSGATAVPMSSTSLAIMAALFMIGGIWILSKTQKKAQGFLVMALLITGAYNLNTIVQADDGGIIIDSAEGEANLHPGSNRIQNNYQEDVKINIAPHGCTITESDRPCGANTVLTTDEWCNVNLTNCPQ